ncbi:hypothetical protein LCGC14_1809860 [marine sediment metagenome]|uniref:Uncharacterized protein n=1 Tax=marine sediment metagenome TaxID=412755 RepID=A0A0F9JLS9_9ZZZZ
MANTTISGITLHDGANAIIIENDCRKEAVLTVLPLYLNDSDLTDVFDFGGTIKVINLTGVYIGADMAALKTWVDSVEALIQGHQDVQAGAPYTFVDDLRGTIKVKILDFNSTKAEGDSTKIAWALKLVQSSTNA